jgi:MYXO-CTERM domain-containing protein
VHVRRSDDGGATWLPLPLTDIELGNAPLIRVEAVSPTSADTLFARSEGVRPPAGDLLYKSIDGGMRWSKVLETTDAIRGVVIRADRTIVVGTVRGGVYSSSDGGDTFAPVASPPEMACLAERSDATLLACGANWSPDNFALGRSSDGAAWTKVFRFVELKGPLACPARTVCDEQWPALQLQLGIPSPVVPDAPVATGDQGCDGCAASGAGAAAVGAIALAMLIGARRRRDCCR